MMYEYRHSQVLHSPFVLNGISSSQDAYIHCAEYDALRIALEAAYHDIEEVKKVVEEKAAAVEVVQQVSIQVVVSRTLRLRLKSCSSHASRYMLGRKCRC